MHVLTSLYHVKINGNYSLLCFIVMCRDITEQGLFFFFLLDSAVKLFSEIFLLRYRKFRDPEKML